MHLSLVRPHWQVFFVYYFTKTNYNKSQISLATDNPTVTIKKHLSDPLEGMGQVWAKKKHACSKIIQAYK